MIELGQVLTFFRGPNRIWVGLFSKWGRYFRFSVVYLRIMSIISLKRGRYFQLGGHYFTFGGRYFQIMGPISSSWVDYFK